MVYFDILILPCTTESVQLSENEIRKSSFCHFQSHRLENYSVSVRIQWRCAEIGFWHCFSVMQLFRR